jgi:hypothetical protein
MHVAKCTCCCAQVHGLQHAADTVVDAIMNYKLCNILKLHRDITITIVQVVMLHGNEFEEAYKPH